MLGQAKAVGGGGVGQGVEVQDGAGREAPVLYRGLKLSKGHFFATGWHKTKPPGCWTPSSSCAMVL